MTALLSLDRLSKRFRGLVAVDGVSFSVPEGAIFAVIGPMAPARQRCSI